MSGNKGLENSSQASKNTSISNQGRISDTIGKGEEAKNSFIWISLKGSFWIGGLITAALFVMTFFSCRTNEFFIESLPKVWDIFVPIITLALGYSFGKGKE